MISTKISYGADAMPVTSRLKWDHLQRERDALPDRERRSRGLRLRGLRERDLEEKTKTISNIFNKK